MDQHLNMSDIVRAGAGEILRSDGAPVASVRAAAARLLDEPGYTASARKLAEAFAAHDARDGFAEVVEEA